MSLRITLHGPSFLSRRRSRHSVSGGEKGKKTIGEKKRRGTETRVCKEMFKRRDQRYGGCLLNSYSDAANDLWLDREKKTRWKKEKKGRRRKKEGRNKEKLQNRSRYSSVRTKSWDRRIWWTDAADTSSVAWVSLRRIERERGRW